MGREVRADWLGYLFEEEAIMQDDEVVQAKKAVLADLEIMRRACEGTEWGDQTASSIREARVHIESVPPVVPVNPEDELDVVVTIPSNDPDAMEAALRAKQNTLADLDVWQRAAELRDAGQDVLRILQQVRMDIISLGWIAPAWIPPTNGEDD